MRVDLVIAAGADVHVASSLVFLARTIVERGGTHANKAGAAHRLGFDLAQIVPRSTVRAVTIITDPLFYALAVPAVVALGLSKGGFSGVGQMATPMLALAMPPLEAAAILLPIMIVQDCSRVWVYRKDWDAPHPRHHDPRRRCSASALAWALAAYVSDAAVRVFIGVIDHRLRALHLDRLRSRDAAPSPSAASGGVFRARSSGFTSTICQAGVPPYQMYVLSQKLPKMTFVGTIAIFFAAVNWLKVVPYVALGQFSTQGPRHLAGAAAAGDRHQPARLLAGAPHPDRSCSTASPMR